MTQPGSEDPVKSSRGHSPPSPTAEPMEPQVPTPRAGSGRTHLPFRTERPRAAAAASVAAVAAAGSPGWAPGTIGAPSPRWIGEPTWAAERGAHISAGSLSDRVTRQHPKSQAGSERARLPSVQGGGAKARPTRARELKSRQPRPGEMGELSLRFL